MMRVIYSTKEISWTRYFFTKLYCIYARTTAGDSAIQNSSSTSNSSSIHISTIRRHTFPGFDGRHLPDRIPCECCPLAFCRAVSSDVISTSDGHYLVLYAMHWIDPLISFFSVCLCVCEQIGCRTITSTVLYRFSRNFACGSEMRSLRRLLFVRQTGSSLPILEVCGFRFWQFTGSHDHIFQQISTKSHIQI